MKIETMRVEELTPDPANARKHDERNLAAIRNSLQAFGQQKPIVIDERGVVVAGNGTLEAAKSLEWQNIKVVRTSLDATQATAFGIADNRTAELAEWDEMTLHSLMQSLDDDMRGLLGFSEDELDKMVAEQADALGGFSESEPIGGEVEACTITGAEVMDQEFRSEVQAIVDKYGLKVRYA